jgi:hypothetical protein
MKTNNGRWTMTLAAAAVLATGMTFSGLTATARADHDDWEDRRERQQEQAEDAIERQRDRADDWYDAAEDTLRREHRRYRRANWFGDWNDDLYDRERERLDRDRERYEDHFDRLENRHDWHHGAAVYRRPPVSVWAGYGYGVPSVRASSVRASRVRASSVRVPSVPVPSFSVPRVPASRIQAPLHAPHPRHCHCGRCEARRLSLQIHVH